MAEFAGPRAAAEFRAFTARARLLFEAFDGPVMRNPRPTPLGVARAAAAGRAAASARDRAALDALGRGRPRQFTDPRLTQLFARYATYVGGSPFLSPGDPRADLAGGGGRASGTSRAAWRRSPRRSRDLAADARRRDPHRRAGRGEIELAGGRVSGVRLADGARLPADAVVFNGDPGALGAGLLGPARARRARPSARPGAAVAVGLGLDLRGAPDGLRARPSHRLLRRRLPRGVRRHLRAAAIRRASPTLYVCAQDRGAGLPPPSGPERLMMILNAPADGDGPPPDREEFEACQTRVFERLRADGADAGARRIRRRR